METHVGLNPIYSYRINKDRSSVFLFYNDGHSFKALSQNLVVEVIASLMDAHQSVDTILNALVNKFDKDNIESTVDQLLADGFLVRQASELSLDVIEQWSSANRTPLQLKEALKKTSVAVESFGINDAAFIERLRLLGVRRSPFDHADFVVALVDNVLSPELEAFSDKATASRKPWILARVVGQKLWFTAFIPEQTPSWSCFAHAVRRNRAGMLWFDTEEHQLYRTKQHSHPVRALSPMGAAHLENLVLHRIFNGDYGQVAGNLFLIDSRSGIPDSGRPIPYTSSCDCSQEHHQPIIPLRSQIKQFTQDGGHRTSEPETAFKTFAHLIDPYVGFFRNLRRVDMGKNSLIHAFMLQYCRTSTLSDSADLLRTDTGYSYGKGISEWQSKASCLFEAIERFSGQWRPDIPVLHSSFEELDAPAVHPRDLLLFSEQQYAHREAWNETCPDKFMVFEPFDEEVAVDWVASYSLSTHEKVYIPAAYGFYNYRGPGPVFAFADSNGCSAGLTKEEAILQGLLEVVERDTLAIAIGQRASFTPVNFNGVTMPYFEEMVTYLKSRRRSLNIYRVPSEINIPCYMAISECMDGEKAILTGYGCHLDPIIAVSRAVTELTQMLYMQSKDSRERALDDTYGTQKKHQASMIKARANKSEEYLIQTQDQTTNDVLDDIQICLTMLKEKGLEVLVLDQTNPEVGCPVVKVMIPGMYQFWYRTGGKRMKEVPISESWRDSVLDEVEIDPVWFVV